MESFRLVTDSGTTYAIRVQEVDEVRNEVIRTLIEIDLQTFSESTFSHYTAAAFLRNGRVFLLQADDAIIGTCVCMRCWDRPNEVSVLSMGLRPGWRGRGLGHKFLVEVMDRLRARGLRAIHLMVSEDNPRAIRLYEESGFEQVASEIADPRSGERFLVMRARLTAPALTPLPAPDRARAE
jgi:ribosomal-protein-alanine N-acetyltransferase